MSMTIQNVIDLIQPGEWHLDADGNLCSDENDDCPLWFAYRYFDPDGDLSDEEYEAHYPECYVEAGRRCGLLDDQAVAIAQAADNRGYPHLRKRLLKAAGLADA